MKSIARMHARYSRAAASFSSACTLLPGATALPSRKILEMHAMNIYATKYRLLTTTSHNCYMQPACGPRVRSDRLSDSTNLVVARRSFSIGRGKFKVNETQPRAPRAHPATKLLSAVQNDAVVDMKLADIDRAQETANASPDSRENHELAPDTPDSGKFLLSFKCKPCDHRMMRFISKQAYRKGVVIVRCESCETLHLMADNLGWFKTSTGHSTVNVEQLLAERGETVRKVLSDLRPDDVKILQDNLDVIVDVPDSLRAQLV